MLEPIWQRCINTLPVRRAENCCRGRWFLAFHPHGSFGGTGSSLVLKSEVQSAYSLSHMPTFLAMVDLWRFCSSATC